MTRHHQIAAALLVAGITWIGVPRSNLRAAALPPDRPTGSGAQSWIGNHTTGRHKTTATPLPTATQPPRPTPTATVSPTAVPSATMTPTPTGSSIPVGMLEPGGSLFTQEGQAGIKLVSIELAWDQAEPSNGSFNESYFQTVRNTIASAQAAGLSPVLSLGIQYTPSWVFALDPASRFVDQYGDVWNQPTSSGEGIANFVFSQTLRAAEKAYIQHVFGDLGTGFVAVRWGGGLPYDEVRYPWCPSGRTNCYWAFDANAKAQNPVPGYIPGSGNLTQAQTFLNWYLQSLQSYITWGMGVIRQSYAGEIDVLFGSWGARPGDITTAISSNLNGTTTRSDQVAAGMDWQDQIPAYATYGNVVAWSTWLNRQDDYTDIASWSPIHYLASLAPAGMGIGGENSAGADSTTNLNATMSNARTYHLRRVMWMDETATQQTGNATIQQVAQAAQ